MKSTDTDAELTLNKASQCRSGEEVFLKGEQRAVKSLLSGLVTEERV